MIVALRQRGEAHAVDSGEPHWVLVDDETGTPVPPLRVQRPDGSVLDAANPHVEKIARPTARMGRAAHEQYRTVALPAGTCCSVRSHAGDRLEQHLAAVPRTALCGSR